MTVQHRDPEPPMVQFVNMTEPFMAGPDVACPFCKVPAGVACRDRFGYGLAYGMCHQGRAPLVQGRPHPITDETVNGPDGKDPIGDARIEANRQRFLTRSRAAAAGTDLGVQLVAAQNLRDSYARLSAQKLLDGLTDDALRYAEQYQDAHEQVRLIVADIRKAYAP